MNGIFNDYLNIAFTFYKYFEIFWNTLEMLNFDILWIFHKINWDATLYKYCKGIKYISVSAVILQQHLQERCIIFEYTQKSIFEYTLYQKVKRSSILFSKKSNFQEKVTL